MSLMIETEEEVTLRFGGRVNSSSSSTSNALFFIPLVILIEVPGVEVVGAVKVVLVVVAVEAVVVVVVVVVVSPFHELNEFPIGHNDFIVIIIVHPNIFVYFGGGT